MKKESSDRGPMSPVMEQLRGLTLDQVEHFLEQKKEDAKAGIGVLNLTELGIVPAVGVEVRGMPLKYQFYVAYVPAGGHVNSHYHKCGVEPYRFMFPKSGGEMNVGRTKRTIFGGKDIGVKWQKPYPIKEGSEVMVQEQEVHSFYNTTDQPVFFCFSCPCEHLIDFNSEDPKKNGTTPGDLNFADRYLTEHLPNQEGIPPRHRK